MRERWVPEDLQPQWQAATEELAAASQLLNEASARYHTAIIARIMLSQLIEERQ